MGNRLFVLESIHPGGSAFHEVKPMDVIIVNPAIGLLRKHAATQMGILSGFLSRRAWVSLCRFR